MKKEDIEKAARSYSSIWAGTPLHVNDILKKDDFESGFQDGAEWRIESVWHYTDKELPKIGKHVVTDEEGWLDFIAEDKNDLKRIIKKYQFKRWAYVDDLKPMED